MRTTLLVCLAAYIAMLRVNALLAQPGKQSGSFAVLDLMRLPLGILSSVGFISAGTILRQDGLVIGSADTSVEFRADNDEQKIFR